MNKTQYKGAHLFNLNFTFFARMPKSVFYNACPACHSSAIQPVLEVKDFTVSGDVFAIWHCHTCTLRFTQNIPSADAIGKFYQSNDYVSHSDTRRGIINQLYHSVRNITLIQKRKLVQQATGLPTGTLLDIGAGTGAFAAEMLKAGWHVTALEPDETARQNAKKNYGINLQLPGQLFVQPAESFAAITLWHVLEHVHELHSYLQTFQTILKPNGALVIAVPNYTGFDAGYYKEYWAAYDVPRHLYHFSPQSMKQLVSQYGFAVVQMKPMPFDAFYVSLLSEKYKWGKNGFASAFFIGLQTNVKAMGKPEKSSSVIYVMKKN